MSDNFVVIIGAGPAGLQAGYFCEKFKMDYLILERGENVSNFFRVFPKHRKLISINKPNNGINNPEDPLRFDWNSLLCDDLKFTDYTDEYYPHADVLVKYMEDFQEKYKLNIKFNSNVASIDKDKGGRFVVCTEDGEEYRSTILISAAGFGEINIPEGIKGSELGETYWGMDPKSTKYKNKKVLILGKGNSAFETAKGLIEQCDEIFLASPNKLRFAHETHYVGSIRSTNDLTYENYQLKSKNICLDATPVSIERTEKGTLKVHLTAELNDYNFEFDHVIFATGFKMNTSLYSNQVKPDMTNCGKLPLVDEKFMSRNVENLYFAGCLMHSCDYRVGTSGFIHGFRHNVEFLIRYLAKQHFSQPLEYQKIKFDVPTLSKYFLDRATKGAGLFLQIKTLADVAVVNLETQEIKYYIDLRRDFIINGGIGHSENEILVVMHLNYGTFYVPGKEGRRPKPTEHELGHTSPYLHPYFNIYRYSNGAVQQIGEYQLLENVFNMFNQDSFQARNLEMLEQAFQKFSYPKLGQATLQRQLNLSSDLDSNYLVLHRLFGGHNRMNKEKGIYFKFLDYIPFKYERDGLVFVKNYFSRGSSFIVKDINSNPWALRILEVCEERGTLILEIAPENCKISMGYIMYEMTWNIESKLFNINLSYFTDLQGDFVKETLSLLESFHV